MITRSLVALLCAATLLMAGCGGDDDDGEDAGNVFTDIFTQDANSEPVDYGDPAPLESEIGFGDANDEPRPPGDVL
ncbi:MAG: hypothetical protein H0W93_06220, partial [Gammaproteobacteria bacterium]|nr:hypothetical protein [Gammaproteobacteria bacterium]